nr:nascent polypeptide-associated complex subunit alpha, muscle-specific form-like [Aegilops tauschii subsp. strangulata]
MQQVGVVAAGTQPRVASPPPPRSHTGAIPSAGPPKPRWGPKGPDLGRADDARSRRRAAPLPTAAPPPSCSPACATEPRRRLDAPPGAAPPAPESDREGKGQEAASTSSPRAKPAAGAGDGGEKEEGRGSLEGGGPMRGRAMSPGKSPGMSNAEWRAEVQRREAVTADRRNRAIAKKARDNAARAAAAAASAEAEATRAGMMNPPGSHAQYAPWGQQGVGSPSPQPWGSPSPGYADGDAHGGFNPNYPSYNDSPPAYASSPTPPLRRGALPFSHLGDTDETEADMDDIIAAGSAAAAASPGFATQDETVDLSGGMDGELGYGRKKKKRAARSGEPRIKWASKEEECLAEAWKVVCLDPTTGTNQSIETYWDRIKAEFDERKLVDPYFKGVYMQRGSKAMVNHWGRIQGACNK